MDPSDFAGFWKRLFALLIDSMILGIPVSFLMIIGIALFVAFGPILTQYNLQFLGIAILPLINILVPWFYMAGFESSGWKATPGKMILSIEVTDTEGNQISFGKATGRYFGKVISGLILGIGFFMAGFTERKQALHDIMANCHVVNG